MTVEQAYAEIAEGPASNEAISAAFHRLWSKAGGDTYIKAEWTALSILLNSRGIGV